MLQLSGGQIIQVPAGTLTVRLNGLVRLGLVGEPLAWSEHEPFVSIKKPRYTRHRVSAVHSGVRL